MPHKITWNSFFFVDRIYLDLFHDSAGSNSSSFNQLCLEENKIVRIALSDLTNKCFTHLNFHPKWEKKEKEEKEEKEEKLNEAFQFLLLFFVSI
jgi:hypothetical protein